MLNGLEIVNTCRNMLLKCTADGRPIKVNGEPLGPATGARGKVRLRIYSLHGFLDETCYSRSVFQLPAVAGIRRVVCR